MSTITPSLGKALLEKLKAMSAPHNCPLKVKTIILVILSRKLHKLSEQSWETWARERAGPQGSWLMQSEAIPQNTYPSLLSLRK